MRLIALVPLLLLTAGVGVALARPAAQPVPASVERQIAERAGLESYAPARMITGWRYDHWQYVPGELRIWFYNRSHREVEWVVTPRLTARCDAGKQRTFQLAGNRVYWSQTTDPSVDRYQQQAWRCVKSPSGRSVRMVALSPLPPKKLAAVGLGRLAAAGRLLHG